MTATLVSPAAGGAPKWAQHDYEYGISDSASQLYRHAADARRHFDEALSHRERTVEEQFTLLARRWEDATAHLSSSTALFMHPAYQHIIGLGRAALPSLLRDLAATGNHWFWALRAISGENPVPREDQGDVDRMTNAWLAWGMANGLL